jgi:hypothetical protein
MCVNASTFGRPAGLEGECLSLKPVDDALSLLKGERIWWRDRHSPPSNSDEGISGEKLVDLAGITDHRLEASREDILRVLEREPPLKQLRSETENVSWRQLRDQYRPQARKHVASDIELIRQCPTGRVPTFTPY